jgi:hypothetical protein
MSWLLEESKNKFKLNVLIDYVVHQTLRRGEIYLTDGNNAVALWDFERNEKMSFHYIRRNFEAAKQTYPAGARRSGQVGAKAESRSGFGI